MEAASLSIDLELTQYGQTHPLAVRNRCLEYIVEKYSYHVRIYTDGYKSDSGCGCALFVEHDKTTRSVSLPKSSSVLSAELFAIFQSLCWAKDNNEHKVAIFSDSLSRLQAIKHGKLDNTIVRDILSIHKTMVRKKITQIVDIFAGLDCTFSTLSLRTLENLYPNHVMPAHQIV